MPSRGAAHLAACTLSRPAHFHHLRRLLRPRSWPRATARPWRTSMFMLIRGGGQSAGSDMRRRRSARARSKCRSWPQCCLLPGALRGRAVGCGEGTRSGDLAGVSQRYARMRSSWCTRRSSSTGELLVVHLHGAICQAASQIGHWLPPCFCAPLDASQRRPV
jgi:hypothetical protein